MDDVSNTNDIWSWRHVLRLVDGVKVPTSVNTTEKWTKEEEKLVLFIIRKQHELDNWPCQNAIGGSNFGHSHFRIAAEIDSIDLT